MTDIARSQDSDAYPEPFTLREGLETLAIAGGLAAFIGGVALMSSINSAGSEPVERPEPVVSVYEPELYRNYISR